MNDRPSGVDDFMSNANDRQHEIGGAPQVIERPRKSKRGVVVAVVIVLVIAIVGVVAFAAAGLLTGGSDYAGAGTGSAKVVIKSGQNLSQIGETLVAAGVVKSKAAFVAAAKANPDATKVEPGTFRLAKQMKAALALTALLNPANRVSYVVFVPEGARTARVLSLASKATGLSLADFTAAAARPKTLGIPVWGHGRIEGFLYPATYRFDPNVTATQVLSSMVSRFDQAARALNFVPSAAAIHRSPYDALIVASIIEHEVAPRDYAKAARTIYNRLDKGMRLQLDSTVAYGLGITQLQLTAQQLTTKTPYNTYLIDGLPPTPIGNPGDAAMRAALHPAKGDWLYFVTVNLDTQQTKFSSTYDQFLRDKQEYLNWLASKK